MGTVVCHSFYKLTTRLKNTTIVIVIETFIYMYCEVKWLHAYVPSK